MQHAARLLPQLAFALLLTVASAASALAQRTAIPCPDFGDGPAWGYRLRAFAGGGQTVQDYDAPPPALDAYFLVRESTEDLFATPHGGLRLEATHRSGLSLRLGADYRLYRSLTRATQPAGPPTDSLVEVRTPTGVLIRTDTLRTLPTSELGVYNRHHTVALVGGVGYHRWFGRVAPYVFAEVGYELRVATRGALPPPVAVANPFEPTLPVGPVDSEPFIAEAPGFQYGATAGLDLALGTNFFVGGSLSYTFLGGLGAEADPLAYEQRALTAAVNFGYRL